MKMTEEQLATLNLRLQLLGLETMGGYIRVLTEGVEGNEHLVDTLAYALANRIVVKMTTSPDPSTDASQSMKSLLSPGFEPGFLFQRLSNTTKTAR